jgi:hypothetical protein
MLEYTLYDIFPRALNQENRANMFFEGPESTKGAINHLLHISMPILYLPWEEVNLINLRSKSPPKTQHTIG